MSFKRERGTIGNSEGIVARGTGFVSLGALAGLMGFPGVAFQPGTAACILRRLDVRWRKEGKRGEYVRPTGYTARSFFATHISANMVPAFLEVFEEKLMEDFNTLWAKDEVMTNWNNDLTPAQRLRKIREAIRPRG